MKKKITNIFLYGAGITLLTVAVSFFVDLSRINTRITNFLVNVGIVEFDEGITREQRARINVIYNPSFVFARSRVETTMTYLPIFEINGLSVAERFARDFEMPIDYLTETDISFVFHYNSRELTVYRYSNFIVYLIEQTERACSEKNISSEEAIRVGAQFMQARNLPLVYTEAVVNKYDGTLLITYVNMLSGLLNYAFPTVIEMDEVGNIISIAYYFFEFERLAQCRLKTMRQAFYELPTNFPEGTRIDLKRATLVYFLENSILQPAYLFEGEFEGGGTFRAFVNAAIF